MTMNAPESQSGPTPEEPDGGSHPENTHCRDCDPRHFANRGCRRHGVEVEAQYIAAQNADLDAAKTNYALTRKGYRDQRQAVALEVQDLRHQIRHLVDRVRCMIQQDRIVDCLDRAYAAICEQLDECGPVGGCCLDEPCEFDLDCPDDYDDLVRRIADYEAHLARDKACFATLVAEPAALAARVASAAQEVHDVAEALTKDPSTIDLKVWYAKALVAQRHLQQIWNGFAETKDFLDCLCRVYDCWISAVDAISVLKGIQGVKDCHRDARAAHCKDLADNTAQAIVLEYERICCEPCDDSPRDDGTCECGHGHHHHRDHHEHEHEHGHEHHEHEGHEHEGHEHHGHEGHDHD